MTAAAAGAVTAAAAAGGAAVFCDLLLKTKNNKRNFTKTAQVHFLSAHGRSVTEIWWRDETTNIKTGSWGKGVENSNMVMHAQKIEIIVI